MGQFALLAARAESLKRSRELIRTGRSNPPPEIGKGGSLSTRRKMAFSRGCHWAIVAEFSNIPFFSSGWKCSGCRGKRQVYETRKRTPDFCQTHLQHPALVQSGAAYVHNRQIIPTEHLVRPRRSGAKITALDEVERKHCSGSLVMYRSGACRASGGASEVCLSG
jgi:hypothetical protein